VFDKESMFFYSHLNYEKDRFPKIYERLENKSYRHFYLSVLAFLEKLENIDKSLRKSKKEAEKLLRLEMKGTLSGTLGYLARRDQVKVFMCPLNDTCPDRIYERWPNSNIKCCTPIGTECPFAHHTYELKFKYFL